MRKLLHARLVLRTNRARMVEHPLVKLAAASVTVLVDSLVTTVRSLVHVLKGMVEMPVIMVVRSLVQLELANVNV